MLVAATLAPALALAAEGASATLSRADCVLLLRHHPDADVAYQPGVDVNGKPVTPADLAPESGGAPERIVIALKRPLGQVAPPVPASVAQSDVYLGELSIDVASGRTMLNGRPVDADDEASMIAACRKAGLR